MEIADLTAGRPVWIAPFGRLGTVEQVPGDPRRVAVAMGVMRTSVAVDALFHPAPEDQKAQKTRPRGATAPRNTASGALAPIDHDAMSPPAKVPDNTCDVRGMYREDAMAELARCLDAAASRQALAIWVVHGHGSGILKEAVRDYLATSSYVTHFRPGERAEGGDGVTLAWLE
jgi:DNA mismatch repair protein MutS2